MNYSEKLRDPRWQKKRLQIMERDSFTCRGCGSDKITLNIHHLKYEPDPWLSRDEDLLTLCESCHESAENSISSIKDNLVKIQQLTGVTGIDEIDRIVRELVNIPPNELMGVRKVVCARPDFEVLLKLFRHG